MSTEDINLENLRKAQTEAKKEIIDQAEENPITSEDVTEEKPKFFVSEEGGEQTFDIEKAVKARRTKMAEEEKMSQLETQISKTIDKTTEKPKVPLQVNDNTNKELFVTEQKPEKKPWWKFF